MKKLIYILVILIAFSSCNEYQKALKSEDIATKFKLGTELYDAGKYNKANRLFEQIVPKYRGKPQAQKLMYMYSMTFYKTRDYYTANYQMERFVSSYANSEKVEEIAYLGAKSYYHLSPIFSKEQKETIEAIEKLQGFINRFPESEYLSEANILVKELEYKLENKAYSIAKQYNHIEDFEASIKSFDNFILEFPGTSLRENAMFYRLDSAYKLAINSVHRKKEDRLKRAITYFNSFNRAYANSEHKTEADKMNEELNGLLQEFITKS
ncbi:MAG: outer membrane protein assembly factor BamD [Flavobacteriaceae bacterium]|nr:outer membrane protein assembly factor BamD [Flavobacteriaceae bacterium]